MNRETTNRESTNRASRYRVLAALLTLAVLSVSAASAGGEGEGGLSAQLLDRTQGATIDQRFALVAELGVEAGWVQELARGVATFTEGDGSSSPELQTSLLYQARLARLLGDRSAVAPLRTLATTARVPDGLAYEAMVSLDTLGGSVDLLLDLARNAEPGRARLAVLALALNPQAARALDTVRQERGTEAELSGAFQFVDLARHDMRIYNELPGVEQRLAFLEERLRRAYNPVNGVTQTWDPYSAGHPVSRWAMDEWRTATGQAPGIATRKIAGVQGYPAPGAEKNYRAFLTDLAAPTVRAMLPPSKEP